MTPETTPAPEVIDKGTRQPVEFIGGDDNFTVKKSEERAPTTDEGPAPASPPDVPEPSKIISVASLKTVNTTIPMARYIELGISGAISLGFELSDANTLIPTGLTVTEVEGVTTDQNGVQWLQNPLRERLIPLVSSLFRVFNVPQSMQRQPAFHVETKSHKNEQGYQIQEHVYGGGYLPAKFPRFMGLAGVVVTMPDPEDPHPNPNPKQRRMIQREMPLDFPLNVPTLTEAFAIFAETAKAEGDKMAAKIKEETAGPRIQIAQPGAMPTGPRRREPFRPPSR